MPPETFSIPRPQTMARRAFPRLLESTLIPLAVFYLFFWTVGVWGALIAALVWSYAALTRRLIRREEIPGILILGVVGLTLRTAIALASGSVFIYFLQPTVAMVGVSLAFLLSLFRGRPLAERLAHDVLPLSPEMVAQPAVRGFFLRVSLLWGVVFLGNAGATFWLLITQPVGMFVITKTIVSMAIILTSIGVSWLIFQRTMRRHGVAVRFATG